MSTGEWHVRRGDQTFAAGDLDLICSWAKSGRIARSDTVWNPVVQQWQPVLNVPELHAILIAPRPCPLDQATLIPAEIHGVTIDYCPTCGGVWLDRGELELMQKTIEKDQSGALANGLLMGMMMSR